MRLGALGRIGIPLYFKGVRCFFFLLLAWALAQPPKGVSKRAYELYNQAVRSLQARRLSEARSLLEQALKLESQYEDAWILLGKVALIERDPIGLLEAGQGLMRLSRGSPEAKPWGWYFQGKAYLLQQRYEAAAAVLDSAVRRGAGLLPKRIYEEAALLEVQSRNAATFIANPVPLRLENLGAAVNSPYDEYLPSLTADGRRLYFTSRRPKSGAPANPLQGPDEDLYWSEWLEAGGWQTCQPLGPPINTSQNEGAAFFSADGQWAFLTLCDRKDGLGSCDLYFSRLEGQAWLPPQNLGPVVNSPEWESHPTLTHDRKRLYFASGRKGSLGGSDIWYTEWRDGAWQPPINLGPPVNTPGNEYSPMIAADGRTLYFASDYHPGLGGMDLFVTYLSDTGWTQPQNLGYPLNTAGDEQTLCVDASGRIAYVALERPEGLGRLDIYRFALWPSVRPREGATYVRGLVRDKASSKPLEAQVYIVDLAQRDTIRSLSSNKASGEFLTSLLMGRRYAVYVQAPGYLFYSGHFDLTQRDTAYELVVELARPVRGSQLTLRNVFFDFDKATLRPESEVELREVVKLLMTYPKVRVEIQGHTDSIGTATYNLQLSQRRAEAVRDFLIANGIAAGRLVARGYGSSRPVADNRTEEGRALNRRTELVFLEGP